ncbi:MAG: glycoside hydrolase family 15 protein [Synechococcus sp.]
MVVAPTQTATRLAEFDRAIEQVILERQDPISGLLPASTAHTIHGNYGDAWVRDCVYSIQCVWGLAIATRRQHGDQNRRAWELEQRVVSLMRGLMQAMLRQADKVERFKHSLDPLDALHAKYDSCLGTPVVPDDGWGHLQLDATSLFLLQLAQLTRSGLPVVRNSHEADFIQNLVHYIARTYRTPDYGIWERGDKGNHGLPERNASSIGMAKAALEALDGLDLYGPYGDGSQRLLIPQGALVRMRRALQNLLPRESASKEADSACLSIVGYPAWSVDEAELRDRTTRRIRRDLAGHYGYKRFLRDGHQSAIEDSSRLHYEPEELAEFEHIESEWPLFMAYELVTACFEERWDDAKAWLNRLTPLAVKRDGLVLYPELYWIPGDRVEAERDAPGSQQRIANDNLPLLWTQSLVWLGEMLLEGLIRPDDLDPCRRRLGEQVGTETVLIAIAPGSEAVQRELADAGLPLELSDQITILSSTELEAKLRHVGSNPRLGLSGGPVERIDSEEAARFYRQGTQCFAVTPAVLENSSSYLANDPMQFLDTVVDELHLLGRHWRGDGLPLLVLPISDDLLTKNRQAILTLLHDCRSGSVNGVRVQLETLSSLMEQGQWISLPPSTEEAAPSKDAPPPSGLLRTVTDLRDLTADQEQELDDTPLAELRQRLWSSSSLVEQAEILDLLRVRLSSDASLTAPDGTPARLQTLLDEVYNRGLHCQDWNVVRRCAGAMGMVHPQLEDALTDLLLRQTQVVVGRNYTTDSRLTQPRSSNAIAALIQRTSGQDAREHMLEQEILLALDGISRREPTLLKGSLTMQLGQLLLLLTSELASEHALSQDQAFERVCALSPNALRQRLRLVLTDVGQARAALKRGEQLHVSGTVQWTVPEPLQERPSGGDWLQHRIRMGTLQKVPRDFYPGIWSLLRHCRGLVIGDKLERRNRLNSRVVLEKTAGEANFARQVEHLLSRVSAPEYRQLCSECLLSLMAFANANPTVVFDDDLVLDVVIGHAVRVGWQQSHPDLDVADYPQHKAKAWGQFYAASPAECRRWQIAALRELAAAEGLVELKSD